MKRVFDLKTYAKAMGYTESEAKVLHPWAAECDGKEVVSGHIAGTLYIASSNWCRTVNEKPVPVETQKIVITSDGKTTTARLYDGKTVLRSAEAKCSPKDTYSFEAGALIAFERLISKKPEEKTNRKIKVGDKIRILDGSHIKNYSGSWVQLMEKYIGSVLTVENIIGNKVIVKECLFVFDLRAVELVE